MQNHLAKKSTTLYMWYHGRPLLGSTPTLHQDFLGEINIHVLQKVQNPPPSTKLLKFGSPLFPRNVGLLNWLSFGVFVIILLEKLDSWLSLCPDKSPSSCAIVLYYFVLLCTILLCTVFIILQHPHPTCAKNPRVRHFAVLLSAQACHR